MNAVLSVLAQIGRTDPALLRPDQTLNSININKSLGLALLRSALERKFQRKFAWIQWETTIQQLLDAADGTGGAGSAQANVRDNVFHAPRPSASGASNRWSGAGAHVLGHGVDIQDISSLPETSGKWEENPFYAEHFTSEELAAARSRPNARAHLAGLWSAKEAVKKSDPELMALEFKDITIIHDASGRPSVRVPDGKLRGDVGVMVSISHSATFAFASAIVVGR